MCHASALAVLCVVACWPTIHTIEPCGSTCIIGRQLRGLVIHVMCLCLQPRAAFTLSTPAVACRARHGCGRRCSGWRTRMLGWRTHCGIRKCTKPPPRRRRRGPMPSAPACSAPAMRPLPRCGCEDMSTDVPSGHANVRRILATQGKTPTRHMVTWSYAGKALALLQLAAPLQPCLLRHYPFAVSVHVAL